MTSPPVSLAPPSLLSSDKSGDEDDIETFAHGSVPAHAADVTEASGNIKEASRVVENTGIRLRLRIRSNGRRIAVCAQTSKEASFFFREGAKIINTHVGIVQLCFFGS
ncbi:hypothetical protein PC118_g7257 [Phytophthora cactorum]|uniref:Uncharacterized protein n=1 Tax=Phytophthora cactorum TaxID=29920 RepID=A0A8T1G9W4_9STRA|nr:hypothetical protein PC118_g7257 [Phytophthora cactorum]KAG3085700.1 hypothetical protein PC122_g9557 [Phytophthora cactorum]